MRAPIFALVWVAATVAAVAVAGCGSSSDDGSKQSTTAAPANAPITIQAPADGRRLKATKVKSGLLRARVRVRGRARARSTVFLSAGCRPERCQAQASAGADGAWATTMTLRAPPSASFVTIDANARRDVVASGSAVATVELVGPEQSRARRSTREREASSGSGASATRAPARRRLPRDVLVIGDSLAMGIAEPLRAALPGWRVRTDGRIGRPLAEGMKILAQESSPPAILAFSLFTNDDPRNTGALEAAVRSTATRQGGCVVWSTVAAPPVDGVSYDAANTVLAALASDPELAGSLQVVDWAAEVAQSPSLVTPKDGVHGTAAGYRVLAQLYAAAIQSCAGIG